MGIMLRSFEVGEVGEDKRVLCACFEHVAQVLFLLDLAFCFGVFGRDAPRIEMDHVVPFEAF